MFQGEANAVVRRRNLEPAVSISRLAPTDVRLVDLSEVVGGKTVHDLSGGPESRQDFGFDRGRAHAKKSGM
jgi:hypothetical protein